MNDDRYGRLKELVKKPASIARIHIDHWSDFFRLLNFFSRRDTGGWQWVFRGQENAFEQMQMVPRMLFPDLEGLAKDVRYLR